jgi:molybdopterin/thiamine biosynthesis adenylyltransferase
VEKPAIKRFYRVYRRGDEEPIYIGVGPDKLAIDSPTPEMEEFLRALDGTRTCDELRQRFSHSDEWLSDLEDAGVLEDAALPTPVAPETASRYARQISYLRLYDRPGWSGWDAIEALRHARVVVVGTGAGGTTLLRLLAAAGIGTLEAIDFDVIQVDNLATHGTIDEEDVGGPKLEAVRRHLHRANSGVRFIRHDQRITAWEEIAERADGADFLLQAFDRPRDRSEAARWTNEAGLATGVPFSSIGVLDKGARGGPIVLPGQSACFDCVGMTELPHIRWELEQPLMASTVFMLAGIMVGEIVKVITGSAPSRLVGRSLFVNTETLEFQFTDHPSNPECRCRTTGRTPEVAHELAGTA